jgi:hypothetical protein
VDKALDTTTQQLEIVVGRIVPMMLISPSVVTARHAIKLDILLLANGLLMM